MSHSNLNPASGWGVVRLTPWHLAGIFETSPEAEALADALGSGYVVRYGEGREASGEFAWRSPDAI